MKQIECEYLNLRILFFGEWHASDMADKMCVDEEYAKIKWLSPMFWGDSGPLFYRDPVEDSICSEVYDNHIMHPEILDIQMYNQSVQSDEVEDISDLFE